MNRLIWCCLAFLMLSRLSPAQTMYLDELNLSAMECGWGTPAARRSVDGNSLKVGGRSFERGVGTHAVSTFLLNLDGKGKRFTASVGLASTAPLVAFGASPRASIALAQSARAMAFLRGRAYVVPEDIQALAPDVLRHRVVLTFEAEAEDVTTDTVVSRVLGAVAVP